MDNSNLVSDALLQTDPDLYAAIDGGISWLAAIRQRGARVKLYRNYERGDHRADLTDQMRKMLRLVQDDAQINDFNDNYCKIIIDKMAGRVAVAGITTGDPNTDKNWLAPMLKRQDFRAAQGMWWRGGIRDGDAFVMIDPTTGLWANEPAFDQFSGVVAVYDQMTRKPVWACKMWSESDTADRSTSDDESSGGTATMMRLVVLQPEKISYWEGKEGGAEVTARKTGDGEVTDWPAEMGGALPLISFANQRDNYTRYGDSEIRPAIPLQDLLNRTMYNMAMAGDFAAFGLNYSIGFEVDPGGMVPGGIINLVLKDASGNVITDLSDGQLAFLNAAKVGQFPATDIGQYIEEFKAIVQEISQVSQTPIYGVTVAGAISGEALKQLEVGLIGKVQRFEDQNTDALEELIILTAQMERVFQPGLGTPEVKTVNVAWRPAELLDTNALIATLYTMNEKMPGLWSKDFYRRRIGSLLGMSDEDVAKESAAAKNEEQEEADEMNDAEAALAAARGPVRQDSAEDEMGMDEE